MFPFPGDLPNSGTKARAPTLQADSLPAEPPRKSTILERPLANPHKVGALGVAVSLSVKRSDELPGLKSGVKTESTLVLCPVHGT